jgi:hypothetical protein
MTRTTWVALAATALALPTHAATIRVPADQPTIQAGVDAAAQGDTVLVAPGTYYGAPGSTSCVVMNKAIALIGEGGAAVTRIDGEGARRAISSVTNQAGRLIRGFTFTDGYADTGGAVHAGGRGFVTIEDNVFEDNVATIEGGGLYLSAEGQSAVGAITGNGFTANSAALGGAACYISAHDPTFDRNVVSDNRNACAVYIEAFYGAIYITNSLFANNAGCGLAATSQCAGLIIARCTFVDNLYAESFYGVDVDQTVIVGNFYIEGYPDYGCEPAVWLSHMDLVGTLLTYSVEYVRWYQPNLAADPLFCDAVGGDYSLEALSPCLPQNNPWGLQIGAFGQGCGFPVSLTPESWARIKARYR